MLLHYVLSVYIYCEYLLHIILVHRAAPALIDKIYNTHTFIYYFESIFRFIWNERFAPLTRYKSE